MLTIVFLGFVIVEAALCGARAGASALASDCGLLGAELMDLHREQIELLWREDLFEFAQGDLVGWGAVDEFAKSITTGTIRMVWAGGAIVLACLALSLALAVVCMIGSIEPRTIGVVLLGGGLHFGFEIFDLVGVFFLELLHRLAVLGDDGLDLLALGFAQCQFVGELASLGVLEGYEVVAEHDRTIILPYVIVHHLVFAIRWGETIMFRGGDIRASEDVLLARIFIWTSEGKPGAEGQGEDDRGGWGVRTAVCFVCRVCHGFGLPVYSLCSPAQRGIHEYIAFIGKI